MSSLSEELAKIIHRKRRAFRFTQADLGRRIGVSGSYISGIENGKTSPRLSELEELAAHFRTTAFELLAEARQGTERFVPATTLETGGPSLDEIAAELDRPTRRLARDFLLFLRERTEDDEGGGKDSPTVPAEDSMSDTTSPPAAGGMS